VEKFGSVFIDDQSFNANKTNLAKLFLATNVNTSNAMVEELRTKTYTRCMSHNTWDYKNALGAGAAT
jgi:hypothetical protein